MKEQAAAPGTLGFCLALLRRQLTLAARRPIEIGNPLLFFMMVVALFPLGLGPSPEKLAGFAPGILWIIALLSNLLTSDTVFRSDFEDGSLEQLDEAAAVTGLAGSLPPADFQRRQRADAAAQLDKDSPAGSRKVGQREPRPTQQQEAAEDDENDEQQVRHDQDVGEDAVAHAGAGRHFRSCR